MDSLAPFPKYYNESFLYHQQKQIHKDYIYKTVLVFFPSQIEDRFVLSA